MLDAEDRTIRYWFTIHPHIYVNTPLERQRARVKIFISFHQSIKEVVVLHKILVQLAGTLYQLLCMVVSAVITFSVGGELYEQFGHIVAAVACAVLSIPFWIVAKRLRDSVRPGLRLMEFFVFHLAWMFDINAVVLVAGKIFKLFGI